MRLLDTLCFWCQIATCTLWCMTVVLLGEGQLWGRILGIVIALLALVGSVRWMATNEESPDA